MLSKIWYILPLFCLIIACNKQQSNTNTTSNTSNIDEEQGIWSIKSYLDDEWKIIKTEQYVLLRTIEEDGQIDSSYVELNDQNFKELRSFFDPTDINQETFKPLYQVSESGDFKNAYLFLHYQALNDDLLTQKIDVGFHDETMKILSVYIETKKESFLKSEYKKLNYNSHKSIVIQEEEKPLFGKDKRRITRYFYNY